VPSGASAKKRAAADIQIRFCGPYVWIGREKRIFLSPITNGHQMRVVRSVK
jgi:hypothetical protein